MVGSLSDANNQLYLKSAIYVDVLSINFLYEVYICSILLYKNIVKCLFLNNISIIHLPQNEHNNSRRNARKNFDNWWLTEKYRYEIYEPEKIVKKVDDTNCLKYRQENLSIIQRKDEILCLGKIIFLNNSEIYTCITYMCL